MLVRKALAGHLARPLHLVGGPLLIVPRVGAGAGVKLPGIGEEGLELRVGEQGIQHGSPSNVVKRAHSID